MTNDEVPQHEFDSHIDGRDATVRVYPDRIEWQATSAPEEGAGKAEVIPMSAVTDVTTKEHEGHTVLSIATSGDTLEARVPHKHAIRIQQTVISNLR